MVTSANALELEAKTATNAAVVVFELIVRFLAKPQAYTLAR